MLRHTVAALPVPTMALVGAALVVWFGLLGRWPGAIWLSAGIAVGVLGAGVSRLYDEVAAELVDTLPRSLRWRTAARLVPAGCLASAWLVGVRASGTAPGSDPALLSRYGIGMILLVTAVCTVLRARGQERPSVAIGSAVLLTTVFLSVRNPLPRIVPLFPLVEDPEVAAGARLWDAITLASGAVLVATLAREGRGRVRRRIVGGHGG